MSNSAATPVVTTPMLNGDALADARSLEEIMAVLADAGIEVTAAAEVIGDGFAVLDDKDKLVKQSFLLIDYKFSDGEYGSDFAIVRVMTKSNDKYVVTDGSEGIREQVRTLQTKGIHGGIWFENGLVRSDYFRDEKTGLIHKTKETPDCVPARTYYLAS